MNRPPIRSLRALRRRLRALLWLHRSGFCLQKPGRLSAAPA